MNSNARSAKTRGRAAAASWSDGVVGFSVAAAAMVRLVCAGGAGTQGWDFDPKRRAAIQEAGAGVHSSIARLCSALSPPRRLWLFLAARDLGSRESALGRALLDGDLVLDACEGDFRAARERAARIRARGADYADLAVTSVPGAEGTGLAFSIGGLPGARERARLALREIAGESALVVDCGGDGAAHFVREVQREMEQVGREAWEQSLSVLRREPGALVAPADLLSLWTSGAERTRRLGYLADEYLRGVAMEAGGVDSAAGRLASALAVAGRGAALYAEAVAAVTATGASGRA